MMVPATPRVERSPVAVTAARALAVTWTPDGLSEGASFSDSGSCSSERRDVSGSGTAA
jgi:hypothetical protein